MDKHDVYALLLDMGVLEYGGVISSTNFRKLCGIDEVITGTKKEFDCQSLQELNYIGFIRDRLLNQGKYIKQVGENYRVLLPSENHSQIMSMMESADSKLKKAIKLDKNTPVDLKVTTDTDMVRMVMKRESIRKRTNK